MKRKPLRNIHINSDIWKYRTDSHGALVYSPRVSKGTPPIRIDRNEIITLNEQERRDLAAFAPSSIKAAIEVYVLKSREPLLNKNMVDQHKFGVYHKFNVSRVDRRDKIGGDRFGANYFVLDLTHDPFAQEALKAYIHACRKTYPAFAADLTAHIK